LLKTGHPDEAISFFAAAVENNPKFEHAWFYLGETQRLSGQTEAAKKAYQSCLSLNPNHGRALASLAFMDHAKK
jgi:predicted TPR repeat methyltransferase